MTSRPVSAIVQPLPAVAEVLWRAVREEAEALLRVSPELGGLVVPTVFHASSIADATARRISVRLAGAALPDRLLYDAFSEAFAVDPAIAAALSTDLKAVLDRDPATTRAIEPLLYFKGFHAIQTHRLAHWLWKSGRRDFAFYLQSRSSEVFQTDIHPAVPMGEGVFLDHATGLVVGATAVIEDHVSILQGVTLGGTGKQSGDRHPKIRRGVLIGAGAKILGNIEIGRCARIAAGSVVLRPVPPNTTVAGVPARTVGPAGCPDPASAMDQTLDRDAYDAFDYVI
ncbi:MAG: serine O-acetyltransferase [Bacteroidales bacterium]|nr:serine O-acetyltransferase [Bacteroidales bacterium]